MKSIARQRQVSRRTRHRRIRKHLAGDATRPRLCIYRSHAHIYAQVVNDQDGMTLAGASSASPELAEQIGGLAKTATSKAVGKLIAARAIAKGVKLVCFDRGGYLYHGRVRALAEGAREGGLEF